MKLHILVTPLLPTISQIYKILTLFSPIKPNKYKFYPHNLTTKGPKVHWKLDFQQYNICSEQNTYPSPEHFTQI